MLAYHVTFSILNMFCQQVLDWMLGKGHAALLRRAELKTFVDFHGNEVYNSTKLWLVASSL